MKNRFFINKLGLVNFWYYDVEEFKLSNGNLLLRGSNGCGKSVTMQSFIPLLLDGNKSPERLDPFGTRARTIANYLLDEDDTEKTAYLYMEFKNGESDSYITLGMGMKAVKNKPVQSWYFIVSDGRRIGKDLLLYRNAGEMIPLTKKQLQNELKEGNFYTESQKTYMEMVNKYLFGFDDIESYEELLNLLISIRSPKLSKDFKPTEIYKILTDSLKVLSDEDLRPISDSMENMDSLKDSLDENKNSLRAINNIKYHYDRYNTSLLLEKSRKFADTYKKLKDNHKEQDNLNKSYKEFRIKVDDALKEREFKDDELKSAEEKYEKLINKEEFKSKKELEDIKKNIEENIKEKSKKENNLKDKNGKETETRYDIKEISDSTEIIEKELTEIMKELDDTAKEINMQQCIGIGTEDISVLTETDLDFCDDSIRKLEKKLKEAEVYFKKLENQKEKTEEALKELDDSEKENVIKKKDMERAEEILLTEKENYKVNINSLLNTNRLYTLDDKEKLKVFTSVDVIDDYNNIQDLNNVVQNYYNDKVNDKNACINIENKVIKEYKDKIRNIENEIEELKNNKEIEPERSEEVKANRKRLEKLNVKFMPLYKALNFNKDVNENIRNYVERSLDNMGLLDALVIDPKDKEKAMEFEEGMEDKYIFSNPNIMSYNLSSMLCVDKALKGDELFSEIDNVLQSIFLDNNGTTCLNEKGYYKIGIIEGRSSNDYEQKFIGEASRKRHREKIIEGKMQEIKEIVKLIDKHKLSIEIILKEIDILGNEYKLIPNTDSIYEGVRMVKDLENDLKNLDNKIIKLKEKEFAERQKLNDIKSELMASVQNLDNVKCIKDIEDSLEAADYYKENVTKAKIALNKFISKKSILKLRSDFLDDLLQDIDKLYYEINNLSEKIKSDTLKKNAIEDILSKCDISEIEKDMENCLNIKNNNPQIIKDLSTSIGSYQSSLDVIQGKIDDLVIKQENIKNECDLYENIFMEEYDLQYVCEKEDKEPYEICRKIISEAEESNDKNREHYSNNLTQAINTNSAMLREFNIKETTLFEHDEEDFNIKWFRQRRDFKGKIQGKDVNLLILKNEISKSIEELELLISEEERKVFEEILMNTISQKVKAKIFMSNNWVKKINELMSSMNTSSSLKLSLSWVPKKSESEGQLDISRIIEIFNRGDRNSDKDLRSLGKHFTEKVKEELRKYEGTGEVRNYHSIIKDVLDYRKWYEFKLYYVKNNERKKELTNNAFFQFSGGEKAMSMYIPLFSALYARYEKGRCDCPRIISMDEAFAGVDENNIRDMFRLLKELNLDYILNSQILWGDYDTVDNLAICELIREDNDDVVTVLKYLWNGKEKVLLDE